MAWDVLSRDVLSYIPMGCLRKSIFQRIKANSVNNQKHPDLG